MNRFLTQTTLPQAKNRSSKIPEKFRNKFFPCFRLTSSGECCIIVVDKNTANRGDSLQSSHPLWSARPSTQSSHPLQSFQPTVSSLPVQPDPTPPNRVLQQESQNRRCLNCNPKTDANRNSQTNAPKPMLLTQFNFKHIYLNSI